MKDIVLLNETTGEFLDSSEYKITKATNKLSEAEVVITLEDILSGKIGKEDLIGFLKRHNEINSFGFMKLQGTYLNSEIFRIVMDTGFEKEMFHLLALISQRNTIKKSLEKNCRESCNGWNDLFEVLQIKNRRKMYSFKKFLIEKDLVRMVSIKFSSLEDNDKLYFNPNYFRHASHSSMMSIACFKDITLKKIHKYNTYVLYMNGIIKASEL